MVNLLKSNKEKVFCIGRNKTGTTSLEVVLKEFGYKLGKQHKAERLLKYYKLGHWKPIVKFCKTAEAFQDAPFSWPYTWLILHEHFPEAKFILTTRDEEKWYYSLVNFHSRLFADGIRVPTKEDLQRAKYNYPGFILESNRAVHKTPLDDIYNKEEMIKNYRTHNNSVLHFFKNRSNFLHIDVSEKDSYQQLADFLNKPPLHQSFPHYNKTAS
ncbi:sulfotransferase [Salinimicrobium catena]|uniref:sulfotransferase n=1 Tax=Salinimicrobium catena TaxID=390640 RepID=UPI002FE47EF8